jgi:hypothetical protein
MVTGAGEGLTYRVLTIWRGVCASAWAIQRSLRAEPKEKGAAQRLQFAKTKKLQKVREPFWIEKVDQQHTPLIDLFVVPW